MYSFEKNGRPQSLTSLDAYNSYNYDHSLHLQLEEDAFQQERDAQEKALVRRLDLFILPLICIIDFLQFLDKSTINYAAAFTFKEDLNLQGNQFSMIGSIFYAGYFIYQLPNNYLLQRVPLGRYIGSIVFLWGGVLTAMAFGHNFSQMMAMRFLLGLFEAGIYPSLTLLVSTFYRRTEQAPRLGAFWLCNGFALCLGGLISYGIGNMKTTLFATWQWIMLIMGLVTCVMGVICFLFLIDNPKSPALGLNAEQSVLVEQRTRDNAVFRTTMVKKHQIIEAIKEPRLWCLCLAAMLLNVQNGGITIYNTQLIAAFGFDQLQSVLLSAGSGISDIIYICGSVYIVTRKEGRVLYTAIGLMAMDLIGLLLLLLIPEPKLKLIGFYLCWPYAATYVLILTCISNNVSGYTKKIFYNGFITIFYTIGNFIGPFMLIEDQKPSYYGGMIAYCCSSFLCMICLAIARWSMARINVTRSQHRPDENKPVEQDLTDVEDPGFIYLL
ncbi:major facilitator superfamily domain-containing protein [Chlamydoabsidia padenii]|nr:major facilitator superfamily domain-containing protein [Chlamydoabsidia padenii]